MKKFNVVILLLALMVTQNGSAESAATGSNPMEQDEILISDEALQTFIDLKEKTWYTSYADPMEWQGKCDDEGKNCRFDPGGNLDKFQAARLIMGLLNRRGVIPLDQDENCLSTKFKELKKGEWYGPYVCTAYKWGIIQGEGETGSFGEGINRITAVEILLRALGGKEFLKALYNGPFEANCSMPKYWIDAPAQNSWYYDTALMGHCLKIIEGKPIDGGQYALAASDPLTRAEFAALLYRAKRYQTMSFYNKKDPGTEGIYRYLIVANYEPGAITTCEPGPHFDAIGLEKKGAILYAGNADVQSFMMNNNFRCNPSHDIGGLIGQPDSTETAFGTTSYIIFDVGQSIENFERAYFYEDESTENAYKIFVSDKPAQVDHWILWKENLNGNQILTIQNSEEIPEPTETKDDDSNSIETDEETNPPNNNNEEDGFTQINTIESENNNAPEEDFIDPFTFFEEESTEDSESEAIESTEIQMNPTATGEGETSEPSSANETEESSETSETPDHTPNEVDTNEIDDLGENRKWKGTVGRYHMEYLGNVKNSTEHYEEYEIELWQVDNALYLISVKGFGKEQKISTDPNTIEYAVSYNYEQEGVLKVGKVDPSSGEYHFFAGPFQSQEAENILYEGMAIGGGTESNCEKISLSDSELEEADQCVYFIQTQNTPYQMKGSFEDQIRNGTPEENGSILLIKWQLEVI